MEHVLLHPEADGCQHVVEFDFLGKDSIRYYNRVSVEKPVSALAAGCSSLRDTYLLWMSLGLCRSCRGVCGPFATSCLLGEARCAGADEGEGEGEAMPHGRPKESQGSWLGAEQGASVTPALSPAPPAGASPRAAGGRHCRPSGLTTDIYCHSVLEARVRVKVLAELHSPHTQGGSSCLPSIRWDRGSWVSLV